MGVTNRKGELGEAMVLADLQRKGYGVAIPFGHDLPFDLILIRKDTGALERVQCKYTESDGRSLDVRCQSTSAWVHHTYAAHEVDWIAVFDADDRSLLLRALEHVGRADQAEASIGSGGQRAAQGDPTCRGVLVSRA